MRSGDFERFVEVGAGTFSRVSYAKDAYEKLLRVKPQVFVRGIFTADGGIFASEEWVPVEVTSTGFRWNGFDLHLMVGKQRAFDFMLDRPQPGG